MTPKFARNVYNWPKKFFLEMTPKMNQKKLQKWSPIDPKMVQNDSIVDQQWTQKGPKLTSEMTQQCPQNDPKMTQTPQNDTATTSEWLNPHEWLSQDRTQKTQ